MHERFFFSRARAEIHLRRRFVTRLRSIGFDFSFFFFSSVTLYASFPVPLTLTYTTRKRHRGTIRRNCFSMRAYADTVPGFFLWNTCSERFFFLLHTTRYMKSAAKSLWHGRKGGRRLTYDRLFVRYSSLGDET